MISVGPLADTPLNLFAKDWAEWDGKVPEEALPKGSEAEAPCATAASLEVQI